MLGLTALLLHDAAIAGLPGAVAEQPGTSHLNIGVEPLTRHWVERVGQDTNVRREPDGEIVYSTGVADTSAGSDVDSDMHGDEEFFNGCMWTFRQKVELCDGGNCGEAEILAHDLQRRLLTFYRDRGAPAAPPLEDAAWLTLGTSLEQRRELADSCPGLIVTVLLLLAEVLVFSGSGGASVYAREAEMYAAALEQGAPVQFQTMVDMFPVREAWEGYNRARASMQEGMHSLPGNVAESVDIVISSCSSSLQWLWELDFPAGTRVFVYDKCRNGTW